MEENRPIGLRLPITAIAAGIAYYAMAVLSLYLTDGVAGLATIWPSSGILVGALLLGRKSEQPLIILSAGIASILANAQGGGGWFDSIMFTVANIAEALVIVMLSRNADGRFGSLSNLESVGKFCLAVVVGSLCGALLAAGLTGHATLAFIASWTTTVGMGSLIVAPLIITVTRNISASNGYPSAARLVEASGIFLALVALSIGSFGQTSYPMLFLPLIGVLLATYRLGPTGTAIGVFCLAMAGTWAASTGNGPIRFENHGLDKGTLFFQFYLLSVLIAAWPLSAMLTRQQALVQSIQRGHDLLERAERTANVGHWHFTAATNQLHWSDEVFRIHGWPTDAPSPPHFSALESYHRDDREKVWDILKSSFKQKTSFEYDARIVRPNGEIRHINSIGGAEFDAAGDFTGMFGMIRDVTARVEAEQALEGARLFAEQEAEQARILSETDQLTGIANRRKVMMVLDAALAEAEAQGTSLSIAILDIDHFKAINDSFGHGVGDAVLTEVAALCRDSVRKSDSIGRLGGEEFLIVMPATPPEIAMLVAERVRIAVALADWAASDLDPVTVSIGVAAHEPGADGTWIMQAADAALYRAKHDGRNLLRLAG